MNKLEQELEMKEKQVKFLQKKCRDAGNRINELKLRNEQETQSLKNVIDMKELQDSELRKINEEHKKGLPGFAMGTSPVYQWCCNYCQFKDHCNPPLMRK